MTKPANPKKEKAESNPDFMEKPVMIKIWLLELAKAIKDDVELDKP